MVQALLLTVALIGAAGLLSSAVGSRWPLALMMTALLGTGVLRLDWRRDVVRPYTRLRPSHLLVGLLALAIPLTIYLLTAEVPLLNWSLLTLVGQEAGNAATAGLEMGLLFAIPYLLLLLAVLPTLALVEEYWFRRGTRGWADGVGRSVLFGLAHTLVGVPIGVAILGLGGVGLLFTAIYLRAARALPPADGRQHGPDDAVLVFPVHRFQAATPAQRRGMDASALQHLAYNTIAITFGALVVVLGSLLGIE